MIERQRFWNDFAAAMSTPGMNPQRAARELNLDVSAIYSYQKKKASPAGEYRKEAMKIWLDKYLTDRSWGK